MENDFLRCFESLFKLGVLRVSALQFLPELLVHPAAAGPCNALDVHFPPSIYSTAYQST